MAHQRRPPTLHSVPIDLNQNQLENSDSVSAIDIAPDPDSALSDCESGISGGGASKSSSPTLAFVEQNLVPLAEGDRYFDLIKRRLIAGLGSVVGAQTSIEAIHKHCYATLGARAKQQAFKIYMQAMEQKCGGDANVKFVWCVTSREDLPKVLTYGFGHSGKHLSSGNAYGCGVYFWPDEKPLGSLRFTPIDKHGLRHLLLCRVILGKSELVHPGSNQCHPSSEEFDSGVDNLSSPRKYIVWNTHANTHVLPEYVVSFRAPCCLKGLLKENDRPITPYVPFPKLISELSRVLPPDSIRVISGCYKGHRERRISRHDMIHQIREVAGDKLLMSVIKVFKAKLEKRSENGFDNSVMFR